MLLSSLAADNPLGRMFGDRCRYRNRDSGLAEEKEEKKRESYQYIVARIGMSGRGIIFNVS